MCVPAVHQMTCIYGWNSFLFSVSHIVRLPACLLFLPFRIFLSALQVFPSVNFDLHCSKCFDLSFVWWQWKFILVFRIHSGIPVHSVSIWWGRHKAIENSRILMRFISKILQSTACFWIFLPQGNNHYVSLKWKSRKKKFIIIFHHGTKCKTYMVPPLQRYGIGNVPHNPQIFVIFVLLAELLRDSRWCCEHKTSYTVLYSLWR